MPVLIKDNIERRAAADHRRQPRAGQQRHQPRRAAGRAAARGGRGHRRQDQFVSEWANIRSNNSISGWSAVGGQTRNPYALDRNPCGSSSGSGAAVAAGMVPAGDRHRDRRLGHLPGAINGIVGLKPTVGLVSRTHIVPISHSQDTPGR
jgi:amidase